MNLVMISGELGPIAPENIFTRNDGVRVVDGHIKKYYTINGSIKESRFYYTISGSKAEKLINDYLQGDKVILTGKLISRVDQDGRYWFTINATGISKLDPTEEDV